MTMQSRDRRYCSAGAAARACYDRATRSMGVMMSARQGWLFGAAVGILMSLAGSAGAQTPDLAKQFAPTGTVRVGVLMVSYFAIDDQGALKGVVPDLGNELARRLGVPARLIKFENPVAVIEAFRKGELDATFIGITADRAAAFDFGPVVLDLQTTYLVRASSSIASIAEIDRDGVRLL